MKTLLILYPFIGTTLGATLVFFLKNKINNKLKTILLGSAAGVMLASSFFSLLLPSIELSSDLNNLKWLPSSIGFLFGVLSLIILEKIFIKNKPTKSMMNMAIIIHNIPEGMAVGVAIASLLVNKNIITYASVLTLSLGIAIQNFPEGAIVSLSSKAKDKSKIKAFFDGVISGIVEPIACIITILFTTLITNILPFILSFASAAMIYVIIEELIPDAKSSKSKLLITSLTIGFIIMMILDVMLS